MKKTISVLLVMAMLFSSIAFAAFAEGGKSITLPFVYDKDEYGNDTLKYTVAVKCNGDHIPEPVDPDPADGITPVKPECTEHSTVVYCKYGVHQDEPDIDYTISYNMAKYGDPSRDGEIRDIDESFFEFTVVMAEKYQQKVTITANDAVIEPNATTGRYVLPMTYSYLLMIPETGTMYPNFTLRTTKVTFPPLSAVNSRDGQGYNVYTFNMGEDGSDRGELYERQNGRYGQDYYVKLLVQDGYRECLKNIKTDANDFDQSEYPLGVQLYASYVPSAALPPLDSADHVSHIANIYLYKANGNTVYRYDYLDNEEDNVDEENSEYILCGRIYKIDGEAMKVPEVRLMVQGVKADSMKNVFDWFFRIIRMIVNLLKNFKIFG